MISTLVTVLIIVAVVWILLAIATAFWFAYELTKLAKDNEKISEGFKVLR